MDKRPESLAAELEQQGAHLMALELMLVSLLEAVANAPPGNQEFVASVLNEAASNAKLLADRGVPRRRHRHLYVAHTAYYPPDSGEPWLAQCGSVASRLVRRVKPSWSRRWVDDMTALRADFRFCGSVRRVARLRWCGEFVGDLL